ncbi:hypothetical protein BJ322DRAFT_1210802 [Thelephora terrestris]|uniref:Post-SET domain-containing protein n=1 Tax=Thelephora terrestris TaxID=56493 RepID=A0A9P6HI24_9AGAM|nr:hypothetical protein BJ322DRAFT_1210802 [Thelephora terrestris]
MTIPKAYVPTHPELFVVEFQPGNFASRLVSLKSFEAKETIARISRFTRTPHAAYHTVQCGSALGDNIELHSDLVYVNHSCEPNVAFDLSSKDTSQWHVRALKQVKAGDPLTFFYPSTEWKMAQPFDCLCGSKTCLGRIEGAFILSAEELSSRGFVNPWIWTQLERKANKPRVE